MSLPALTKDRDVTRRSGRGFASAAQAGYAELKRRCRGCEFSRRVAGLGRDRRWPPSATTRAARRRLPGIPDIARGRRPPPAPPRWSARPATERPSGKAARRRSWGYVPGTSGKARLLRRRGRGAVRQIRRRRTRCRACDPSDRGSSPARSPIASRRPDREGRHYTRPIRARLPALDPLLELVRTRATPAPTVLLQSIACLE